PSGRPSGPSTTASRSASTATPTCPPSTATSPPASDPHATGRARGHRARPSTQHPSRCLPSNGSTPKESAMAGETVITIVGNLVDDPELRFTPNGVAVAKFRIASTPRTFNKTTNQWEDGEALFLTCSVWRQAAEHVADSLARGLRVIVQGRLKQRSYEDREGLKRTVYEDRKRGGVER